MKWSVLGPFSAEVIHIQCKHVPGYLSQAACRQMFGVKDGSSPDWIQARSEMGSVCCYMYEYVLLNFEAPKFQLTVQL